LGLLLQSAALTVGDGGNDLVHVHTAYGAGGVEGAEERAASQDKELHGLGVVAVVVVGPPGVEIDKLVRPDAVSDGEGEAVVAGHGLGGGLVIHCSSDDLRTQGLQVFKLGLVGD